MKKLVKISLFSILSITFGSYLKASESGDTKKTAETAQIDLKKQRETLKELTTAYGYYPFANPLRCRPQLTEEQYAAGLKKNEIQEYCEACYKNILKYDSAYDDSSFSFIEWAVHHEDIELIKFFLEQPIPPLWNGNGYDPFYVKDTWSRTLSAALEKKNIVIIRLLLDLIKPDASNDIFLITARHVACAAQDPELFKILCNHIKTSAIDNSSGQDISAEICKLFEDGRTNYHDSETSLHLASEYGNEQLVQMLLKNKADVNAATKIQNLTPLMVASLHERTHVIQMLLDARANPNIQSKKAEKILVKKNRRKAFTVDPHNTIKNTGSTALMLAGNSTSDENSIAIMELLLNAKADPTLKDEQGRTANFAAIFKKAAKSAVETPAVGGQLKEEEGTNAAPIMIPGTSAIRRIVAEFLTESDSEETSRAAGSTFVEAE